MRSKPPQIVVGEFGVDVVPGIGSMANHDVLLGVAADANQARIVIGQEGRVLGLALVAERTLLPHRTVEAKCAPGLPTVAAESQCPGASQ